MPHPFLCRFLLLHFALATPTSPASRDLPSCPSCFLECFWPPLCHMLGMAPQLRRHALRGSPPADHPPRNTPILRSHIPVVSFLPSPRWDVDLFTWLCSVSPAGLRAPRGQGPHPLTSVPPPASHTARQPAAAHRRASTCLARRRRRRSGGCPCGHFCGAGILGKTEAALLKADALPEAQSWVSGPRMIITIVTEANTGGPLAMLWAPPEYVTYHFCLILTSAL